MAIIFQYLLEERKPMEKQRWQRNICPKCTLEPFPATNGSKDKRKKVSQIET